MEECSKNIYGNEMIFNGTLNAISIDSVPQNDYKKVCVSFTLHIVLFVVILVTSTDISTVFIYFC